MAVRREAGVAVNAWAAVPLVALAGCVDGIGWLRLQELFVGFISGTSTLLGLALAGGDAVRAATLGSVVGLFAGGAVAGAAVGLLAGRRWHAAAVLALVALLLHAALLLPFAGVGVSPAVVALVPAMGALNTALPGVGGITFVTGALTRTGQAAVAALAGGPRLAFAPHLAAWAALVAGATAGGVLEARLGPAALLVPAHAALLAALLAGAAAAGEPR